jgi:predicted RNase H-like HicB family nuclease
LVNILKIAGGSLLGLLILLAPFLTILIAKARRRRERVRAAEPENRIVGGWDEYVDAALDNGKPIPTSETRSELARLYGTPRGLILATMADRAVFHADPPQEDASAQFWAIVEAERRSLSAGKTRWQRFRSAISLRSFTRHLTAELPRTRR